MIFTPIILCVLLTLFTLEALNIKEHSHKIKKYDMSHKNNAFLLFLYCVFNTFVSFRADALNMQISIGCKPSYSIATVVLDLGETVYCESGAMAYMSSGLDVSGSMKGGVVKSLMRRNLGEETFFMSKYKAKIDKAWVSLAPRSPGDIDVINIDRGHEYFIEAGASLGHGSSVHVDVKYAGARSIALREGATVLKATGEGPIIICSYGGLQKFELAPGENLIVDTGHLVAWSAGMGMRFGPLNNLITAQMTGEGLVGELTGPGEVWVQTRAEQGIKELFFPERGQNKRR